MRAEERCATKSMSALLASIKSLVQSMKHFKTTSRRHQDSMREKQQAYPAKHQLTFESVKHTN